MGTKLDVPAPEEILDEPKEIILEADAPEEITPEADAPEEIAPELDASEVAAKEADEARDVKDETPAPSEDKDEATAPSEDFSGEGEGGGYWSLQAENVCFAAKGRKPGTFLLKQGGELVGMRLVHKKGTVACAPIRGYHTNFGCGHSATPLSYDNTHVGTFVTDKRSIVVFPKGIKPQNGYYHMPGYHAQSKELDFNDYCTPMIARKDQELRVWYGEDLFKWFDGNNEGESCVDVYASFR